MTRSFILNKNGWVEPRSFNAYSLLENDTYNISHVHRLH